MNEPTLIFVNERPFRVWRRASTYRDADLLLGLRPDVHLKLATPLLEQIDDETVGDAAALGVRLHYGLAQEAFFALLFATLQAPQAPTAWLLRYRTNDLAELIDRFERGEDLPSLLECPEPGSWGALAAMFFPESILDEEAARERIARLGELWGEWATEQRDVHLRAEFNSLKHGIRIRSGAPLLVVGGVRIEGEPHGSSFPYAARSNSEMVLGLRAGSWSAEKLYSRLKLMVASTGNLVEFLKLAHGCGDTSRIELELPDDEELEAATGLSWPLAALRLGPTLDERAEGRKLTYDEAISEYKRGAGIPRLQGRSE